MSLRLHSESRLVRVRSARVRTRPQATSEPLVGLSREFQPESGYSDSKRDLGFVRVNVQAPQCSTLNRISRSPERCSQPDPFGSCHSFQSPVVDFARFVGCIAQQHRTSSISHRGEPSGMWPRAAVCSSPFTQSSTPAPHASLAIPTKSSGCNRRVSWKSNSE